jgi:hypothetical protein
MKYITSGSFKNCLADFFGRFGRVDALWKFAKVDPQTEARWRLHGTIPVGEAYLRVLYFLEFIGYELEELKRVPEVVASIGRCVAFDTITEESVAKRLAYQEKDLFRYTRGGVKPHQDRATTMASIVSENTSALLMVMEKKKREFTSLDIRREARSTATDISGNGSDTERIKRFASACAIIRDDGKELLKGPVEVRRALRREMNNQSPELHRTFDVLHQLLKERKGDQQL